MRFRLAALILTVFIALPAPAWAIDPPYEPQMERLAEILGSLYFLNPLCKPGSTDWRAEMADLVTLDQPDEDRQQRLYGAFNGGFTAYSRLYRTCTPSAGEALARLLIEAEATARDIHTRYAE
ncbi:MAG: TIGR02301 family protein [Devosia sp.]